MERLPWPTLGARRGACDPQWVERAVRSAFRAAARVHERGVVHGDVSPANMSSSAKTGREALLVDFGLAQGPGMPALPAGPFRGTLLVAAPEVARGETFGAPADVFALAASILHVATGEMPRRETSEAAMLVAAGESGLVAWAEQATRGLSTGVAELLKACCALDPSERPPAIALAQPSGTKRRKCEQPPARAHE